MIFFIPVFVPSFVPIWVVADDDDEFVRIEETGDGQGIGPGEDAVLAGDSSIDLEGLFGRMAVGNIVRVSVEAEQRDGGDGVSGWSGGILKRLAAGGENAEDGCGGWSWRRR